MKKCALIFLISIISLDFAHAQSKDTSIFYYRYRIPHYEFAGSRRVGTIDSADFYRVIFPPDSGEDLYNVKEFYVNGRAKFVGKSLGNLGLKNELMSLQEAIPFQGQSISFYYNGKRRLISNYNSGRKEGLEYTYFPEGKLYSIKKYDYTFGKRILFLECYDLKGNVTCKDGNGLWETYDTEYKNIIIQGPVKKGLQEGRWYGGTCDDDSIKFDFQFKKGLLIAGKSYDKNGKEYLFTNIGEPAHYTNGSDIFFQRLRNRIVLPKDEQGNKFRDTVSVSFIVEKDGNLTTFAVVGKPNSALGSATLDALKKSPSWIPRTYYGIPLRSQITVLLDLRADSETPWIYLEKVLDITLKIPKMELIQ